MKVGLCAGCRVRAVVWLVPLTSSRQWFCVACRPKAEAALAKREAA